MSSRTPVRIAQAAMVKTTCKGAAMWPQERQGLDREPENGLEQQRHPAFALMPETDRAGQRNALSTNMYAPKKRISTAKVMPGHAIARMIKDDTEQAAQRDEPPVACDLRDYFRALRASIGIFFAPIGLVGWSTIFSTPFSKVAFALSGLTSRGSMIVRVNAARRISE